jgi:acyl-CoA thioesterase
MTRSFDSDTALEPLAPGRWRASVFEEWFVVGGPNGGFLAALATRAMTETVAAGQPPRSLTLHYLRAPAAGEVQVSAEVQYAGRSTTFLSLRIEQDGETVALGLGCCAAWREGQPEWDDARMPQALPPDESEPMPQPPQGALPFLENYEMRPAIGPSPVGVRAAPDEPAHTASWIRTVAPRGLDSVLVAALADAWLPAAHLRMPEPVFVPTLDLTIHWRAPLDPGAAEHPWVLGSFETRLGAGGFWEEDGELWGADGTLLAHSRQLAIVRAPRP